MRSLWPVLLVGLTASLTSCSSAEESSVQQGGEDEITSIEDTAVKEQTIGNCWLYATAAWAESLHLNATKQHLDVSEGYWSFWYWFEELVGGDLSLRELKGKDITSGDAITQGGWWGIAAELVNRYGWMHEQDFRAGADKLSKAQWHKEAVDEVNASLASGMLSDPAVRNDRIAVFNELARIWKLDKATVSDLTKVFGVGVVRSLGKGAKVSGRVQSPTTLKAPSADGKRVVSLQDVLGTMEAGSTPSEGRRVGKDAWSEIRYQFDPATGADRRRAMLGNIQHAMHQKLAVPLAWAVASSKAGVYGGAQTRYSGLHESVLVDYEIEDVPGFGKLELGVPVTDPKALEAALAPTARITKFRLKNSWGKDPFYSTEEWRQFGYGGTSPTEAKPSYLAARPGYNDVDIAYLDSEATGVDSWYGAHSHFMLAVALPNEQRFAVPVPALKRAFVSYETYRASDLQYLGGADKVCSGLGKKAGIGSSYGAYLVLDGVEPTASFAPDGKLYRALTFKRGTYRARPIAFGDYPGVTQDGTPTTNAVWHKLGAQGCTTTGGAKDATGAETDVACDQKRALVCIEK